MSRSKDPDGLDVSISLIGSALRTHAQTIRDDPENVVAIIQAGNALREAVLEYGRNLMDETGWSNPIRHLGPLPGYSHGQGPNDTLLERDSNSVQVAVDAKYLVAVESEWEIETFVEARGGSRPVSIVEAIRYLYECDGWDVHQYPPRRIRLLDSRCDISLIDSDE